MVKDESECAGWAHRARKITHLLTDCDGVLTDGGVYYGESGETMLRFHRRDGMGVARLRDSGISTSIITRERSPIVQQRARKLDVRLFEGIENKLLLLPMLMRELAAPIEGLAFIGDDVNDLPLLLAIKEFGLTAAPVDAEPCVREAAHFVTKALGGNGALREFCEWLLKLRGSQ